MSLNRNEQMVYDYLQSRPDELRHWEGVVKREAQRADDLHAAALTLEGELWRYYVERAEVTEPFRSARRHEGSHRTSMRNLADRLLRQWAPTTPMRSQFAPDYEANPPPLDS